MDPENVGSPPRGLHQLAGRGEQIGFVCADRATVDAHLREPRGSGRHPRDELVLVIAYDGHRVDRDVIALARIVAVAGLVAVAPEDLGARRPMAVVHAHTMPDHSRKGRSGSPVDSVLGMDEGVATYPEGVDAEDAGFLSALRAVAAA